MPTTSPMRLIRSTLLSRSKTLSNIHVISEQINSKIFEVEEANVTDGWPVNKDNAANEFTSLDKPNFLETWNNTCNKHKQGKQSEKNGECCSEIVPSSDMQCSTSYLTVSSACFSACKRQSTILSSLKRGNFQNAAAVSNLGNDLLGTIINIYKNLTQAAQKFGKDNNICYVKQQRTSLQRMTIC